MGNSGVIEILRDFITLIYPRYCLACEHGLIKGEDIVCTKCMLEMPKTNYHLNIENPFYKKLQGRISVEYVMAQFSFVKKGKVQHLLHTFKYKKHPEIGMALGRVYGAELLQAGFKNKFDLIVPVPLHPTRKRMRGYNQSEEFGKGLSDVLEIPCVEVIDRLVKTKTQTRKTRLNRWDNVSEVFKVSHPDKVVGKRILLVDDIITTGATLEACAKPLLELHCKSISIACIAAAQ